MYPNPAAKAYPKQKIWEMGRKVSGQNYQELKAQLFSTEELLGVYEEDGEILAPLMINKAFYNFYERMAKSGQIQRKGFKAIKT